MTQPPPSTGPIEYIEPNGTWIALLKSNDRSGSILLGQATSDDLAAAGFVTAAKFEAAEQRVRELWKASHLYLSGQTGEGPLREVLYNPNGSTNPTEQAEGAKVTQAERDMLRDNADLQERLVGTQRNVTRLEARLRDLTAEREALLSLERAIRLRWDTWSPESFKMWLGDCDMRLRKLDALRSKPSADSEGKDSRPAADAKPFAPPAPDSKSDDGSSSDVAPVVENTGLLREALASARLDGETIPIDTGEAKPAGQGGWNCTWTSCQNCATKNMRCYDHQPQRCPEPAPKAAFAVGMRVRYKRNGMVGTIARLDAGCANRFVIACEEAFRGASGCFADGLYATADELEPADPAPPPESPNDLLSRSELVAALETSGNEPMKWLARELAGMSKAGRP